MKFQSLHSRNTHDWTIQTGHGRVTMMAKGFGVEQRMGYLVDFLHQNPNQDEDQCLAHLRGIHKGYSMGDTRYALRRMRQNGFAKVRNGRYSLTANGKRRCLPVVARALQYSSPMPALF